MADIGAENTNRKKSQLSLPQNKMRIRLIIFSVFALIVLPMFSGIILSSAYEFIANDIIYGDYDAAIGIIINICTIFSVFAGFAVIDFVYMTELRRRGLIFTVFQFVMYILNFGCALFVQYISGANFMKYFGMYVSYAGISFVISSVILLAFLLILKNEYAKAEKKKIKTSELSGKILSLKEPLLSSGFKISLAWLAVTVVSDAIDTVVLFVEYGAPSTVGDIIYLLTPYAEDIFLCAAGYLIMTGLIYIFHGKYRKLCKNDVKASSEN